MRKIQFLIVLLAILLVPAGVKAMIKSLSLEDLVKKSELIVIATVKSISEVPSDDKTLKSFNNTLSPEKIIKGEWAIESAIDIISVRPSDQAGWVEDLVEFPPVGDKVVLFLEKDKDNKWTLVNHIQGLWPIDSEDGAYLKMGFGVSESQLLEAVSR